jgi:hypothetical protein
MTDSPKGTWLMTSVSVEQVESLEASFVVPRLSEAGQLEWVIPDWLKLLKSVAVGNCPGKCGHKGIEGSAKTLYCNHCYLKPMWRHRLLYRDH